MQSLKIMDEKQLAAKLEQYYNGETSPEEELLLHLALLDLPEDNPQKQHLRVIEGTMTAASRISSTKRSKVLSFKSRSSIGIASVAAACILAIVLIRPASDNDMSNENGTPLAQKDVDRYANEAFERLYLSIEEASNQRAFVEAQLIETDKVLDQTWKRLDELQGLDYWVLTNQ